jgi:predicted nucleotidyltransferase
VTSGLKGYRARICLFGSWASGTAGRTSDIDVAVLPQEPIPHHIFSQVRESLEESRVLYPVELVDLADVSEEFRARVFDEGVLWSD